VLLIDRYIVQRFLANFVILFVLLFLFAAGIDLILNLDEFVSAARGQAGDEAGALRRLALTIAFMVNFQSPRLFLFYSDMHGLIAVAAMGFTLAQMYRHRELVAVLASGVSLHRLSLPFLAAVFGVSLVQLLNQEFMLYRVAPLVLRGHGEIGRRSVEEFPIRFTDDGQGNLLQAALFNPVARRLTDPTILQRDELGRTWRRVTADEATWDESARGWRLTGGRAVTLGEPSRGTADAMNAEAIEFFPSDLDPHALTMRRYGEYAAMLRLSQIEQMLASRRVVDKGTLLRHKYARFASVAVNLLVLFIALPSFLLREPASLLRQSVLCAGMAVPALMGSAVGMMIELPGLPPAVGVFLPVVVLIPLAAGRWTFLRT
jgi:lipopolysaccharide export LptBFGC system permease protein LptF